MIAFIEGKIETLDPTFVLINVNGIGYEIKISLSTFSFLKGKERCRLMTHFHVKEDAHTLFGFFDAEEKRLFLHLVSISGVGPSTALMVQSSLTTKELQDAIVQEKVNIIQGVKGIGAKTAQRIVLELKDKIKKEGFVSLGDEKNSGVNNSLKREALSALVTLGIAKNVAEKNIDTILKKSSEEITTVEELIKLSLKRA